MLRSAYELHGYGAYGVDGDVGTVRDVLFDDDHWAVRYLVVDTGGWLDSRRVLLSPIAVERIDPMGRAVHFRLTRERIEKSPSFDADRPVSRQHEAALFDYYGFPYYWGGPYMWGAFAFPGGPAAAGEALGPQAAVLEMRRRRAEGDPHLRSANEVIDNHIQASDDTIGHVEDLMFDDEDWAIALMVVDTRNWWPGKKVAVSPRRIRHISWADRTVEVDLTREQIESAPEFDPQHPPARDERAELYRPWGSPVAANLAGTPLAERPRR